MKILRWLSEGEVGSSSKAIALTALGEMPNNPQHPHDGADFMRCVKLLTLCPEARAGLVRLSTDGGPIWAALFKQWDEIEAACFHDYKIYDAGNRDHSKYRCYDLMRKIITGAGGW